jgi:hypothetical protein
MARANAPPLGDTARGPARNRSPDSVPARVRSATVTVGAFPLAAPRAR